VFRLLLQWTTVLDILEWFLHERGLTYVRLDGSTAVADRLTIVDSFNDPNGGVFAFLLSTRAGGQGLNLTGADTVVLHDVDFNPQVRRVAGWGSFPDPPSSAVVLTRRRAGGNS
jgi:SWI/SNF-related matrix-associated actin-dependent regulator 1 of chromatin subfamily A